MVYRKATIKDIPELIKMRKQQLIDEGQEPDIDIDQELKQFFSSLLENNSLVEWILEEKGKLVASGAVIFYTFPPSFTNQNGLKGYITNMYTSREYRGQGIATRMLDYIVEEAKARKVTRLFLQASTMGRPVYLKYGFIESDSQLEMVVRE